MSNKFKIHIHAELHDSQGKLIKTFPWRKANSLVKAFILHLGALMSQVAQTIKDTAGVDFAQAIEVFAVRVNAAAAGTTWGLLIGTGTNAVTIADYKLQTQVTANIIHGAVSFVIDYPDLNTGRISITRVFTNNTGASLEIREAALYSINSPSTHIYCLDRTLYSVNVPSGLTVTLTYRITVSL